MRRAFIALLGVGLVAYVALVLTIEGYTRVDETHSAGAIVVLGAGVEEDGSPSEAMQARIEHGLWLYEQGYASLLVLSGGERVRPPAEADVMAAQFLAAGVPEEALVVENLSLDTRQNAAYVAPLLRARGVEEVLLVTSPFHQWRAERVFEHAGFTVHLSPAPGDPAEQLPVKRVLFLAREGAVTSVYILLGY